MNRIKSKKITPTLLTAKTFLTLSLWLGLTTTALADLYSDVANIAANSSQLSSVTSEFMPFLKTLDETAKAMEALTGEHFDWVEAMEEAQWKALTSTYHMGQAIDNAVPTELWSSADWDEALKATSGGNSSRYNQLKSAYAAKNPIITTQTTTPIDVGQLTENTYAQKADVANTALAASQYLYEDTDNRVASFDALKSWLDDPSRNQNEKAAMDLNTRVLIEIGYIQNQLLKLHSIEAQVSAVKAQQEINADTADKQFFNNDSLQ